MAGDNLAVGAFCLFAEPFDIGGAIGNLAHRFGHGFAHFRRQNGGKIGLGGHAQIKPFAHDGGAGFAGAASPFTAGDVGGSNCAGGIGACEIRHSGDDIAARGVGDRKGCPIGGIDPFTRNVGFVWQKTGVFQKGTQVCCGVKHRNSPISWLGMQ